MSTRTISRCPECGQPAPMSGFRGSPHDAAMLATRCNACGFAFAITWDLFTRAAVRRLIPAQLPVYERRSR